MFSRKHRQSIGSRREAAAFLPISTSSFLLSFYWSLEFFSLIRARFFSIFCVLQVLRQAFTNLQNAIVSFSSVSHSSCLKSTQHNSRNKAAHMIEYYRNGEQSSTQIVAIEMANLSIPKAERSFDEVYFSVLCCLNTQNIFINMKVKTSP